MSLSMFRNDGMVIPVEKDVEGYWLPSILFSRFMTGGNFDDKRDRHHVGKNGYARAHGQCPRLERQAALMALFAPDEQDGHPAACRSTNLFKPAQVIARAGGDQRRTVINGQHDLKSLYGTATDCLLECNPGGAAVRRTQPARSQLLGQPGVQMPSLHRVARQGETTARVSRLGECTAEHQGLAHPGRGAGHREPMPGLDGMNQPRDGLLMSRHRYIGSTVLLTKGSRFSPQ